MSFVTHFCPCSFYVKSPGACLDRKMSANYFKSSNLTQKKNERGNTYISSFYLSYYFFYYSSLYLFFHYIYLTVFYLTREKVDTLKSPVLRWEPSGRQNYMGLGEGQKDSYVFIQVLPANIPPFSLLFNYLYEVSQYLSHLSLCIYVLLSNHLNEFKENWEYPEQFTNSYPTPLSSSFWYLQVSLIFNMNMGKLYCSCNLTRKKISNVSN